MTEPKPIKLELTLEELKMIDKYIEYHDYDCDKPLLEKIRNAYPVFRSPAEEAYKDWCGEYPSGPPNEDARWASFLAGYQATQPKAIPVEEPQSKSMDEVIDRLVKKYQAQKLYNRLVNELGYGFHTCNDIVDLVEKWLPEPQNADGSQNVDTELLVDGFNDCVRKMNEMLR
jgi:hypothetical protein